MKENRQIAFWLALAVAAALGAGYFRMRAADLTAQADALRAEGEAQSGQSAEIAKLKKRVAELENELELAK